MIQPKKILAFVLLAICLISVKLPLNFAQESESELTDFVCEVGIKFYENGRFSEALKEFQTVLTIDPENETAKKYIDLIKSQIAAPIVISPFNEQNPSEQKPIEEIFPEERIFPEAKKEQSIDEFMLKMEKEMKGEVYVSESEALAKKNALLGEAALPKVLVLDARAKNLKFPLEIQQTETLIVQGTNIRRYLSTEPDVLYIKKNNPNEISITGKSLGYSYLHIWDNQERWTLEFLTVPLRPVGQTLEEQMRVEEEKSKNFKLLYSFDWSTFESGRRLNSLKKVSTIWSQSIGLAAPVEIPYGELYLGLSVGSTKDTVDLTSISVGLEKGRIGPFKGFSARAFDYNPNISNLAFSPSALRGAMFKSPAFNEKIDYTLFWGREGATKYLGLTPQLTKAKRSYLSGAAVNFSPKVKRKYSLAAFHGYGRDRLPDLHPYGYDFAAHYGFTKWGLDYETAYDTQEFAHRLRTNYNLPKLNLTTELRDTSKDFKSNSGIGSKAGELGVLANLNYKIRENVNFLGGFDVFKDRLYPREGDADIFNEDLYSNIFWQMNPVTTLNLNYGLQNDLGKISPIRYHNAGAGLSRVFNWVRRVNTHTNYYYRRNRSFHSPSSDYESNSVSAGFNFDLIGKVNYFFDQEFAWIDALSVSGSGSPRAFQTGLNWSDQIPRTFFYGTFRLLYRDEENTDSPFSFMGGQDYVEVYGEIAYRPRPNVEAYLNTRVREVWAEKSSVTKGVDFTAYSGLRYMWDTGLHWDAIGTVEGYVFKDLNSDGLRQRDEAPIQGIKVWIGKNKFQVTDIFGYYSFKKIRARKVFLNIDTSTIPAGFVLTGPATQEVAIVQWQKVQANFGIISRTEINGIVFEDIDGNGEYSLNDKGVPGVVFALEDGTEAKTDDYGRYSFSNLTAGKHKITLDLSSLPTIYIPNVPIFRTVDLTEGVTYSYNIPVQKTGD